MSSLDNYEIIPAATTTIRHRNECIPYYDAFYSSEVDAISLAGAYLPIIAAPMSSVINAKNYLEFDKEGILTVIPRTVSLNERLELIDKGIFIALGLDEFKFFVNDNQTVPEGTRICVDLANGHMKDLLLVCKEAKDKFGSNLELMTGNIANPSTYDEYAMVGIDYIRCGIGSGNVCSTSYLSGVHMSMDKLIKGCYQRKLYVQSCVSYNINSFKSVPKIVADGGFQTIRQIIIALALGADYVMLGQILAMCEEACGDKVKLPSGWHREYYGMSTERAQKEMGHTKLKSSEGIEKLVPIKYTVKDWVKKFVSIISSTMSYCDKKELLYFVGQVKVQEASPGEYSSYEKSKNIII